MGFPSGSDGKETACNVGDLGLIPGSGISPGEGNDNPLQYPCLENPMVRGTWQSTVHGIAKSQTWLSNFIITIYIIQVTKKDLLYSTGNYIQYLVKIYNRKESQKKCVCVYIYVYIYIYKLNHFTVHLKTLFSELYFNKHK